MNKPQIHFAHANGFPAKTYSKLFSLLAEDFEIGLLERHEHNPEFPVTDNWQFLRDELREEIRKRYSSEKIEGSHLFAFEKPFETAEKIKQSLNAEITRV